MLCNLLTLAEAHIFGYLVDISLNELNCNLQDNWNSEKND